MRETKEGETKGDPKDHVREGNNRHCSTDAAAAHNRHTRFATATWTIPLPWPGRVLHKAAEEGGAERERERGKGRGDAPPLSLSPATADGRAQDLPTFTPGRSSVRHWYGECRTVFSLREEKEREGEGAEESGRERKR